MSFNIIWSSVCSVVTYVRFKYQPTFIILTINQRALCQQGLFFIILGLLSYFSLYSHSVIAWSRNYSTICFIWKFTSEFEARTAFVIYINDSSSCSSNASLSLLRCPWLTNVQSLFSPETELIWDSALGEMSQHTFNYLPE